MGPETDYNYMVKENMITNTMEEKDIGIIVDNKLNFQNHILIWRPVFGIQIKAYLATHARWAKKKKSTYINTDYFQKILHGYRFSIIVYLKIVEINEVKIK